jgi:hypothetical protein
MTIATPRRYRQLAPMPVRRGDPVAEIEQLQDQLGQILSSFLRDPLMGAGGQRFPRRAARGPGPGEGPGVAARRCADGPGGKGRREPATADPGPGLLRSRTPEGLRIIGFGRRQAGAGG